MSLAEPNEVFRSVDFEKIEDTEPIVENIQVEIVVVDQNSFPRVEALEVTGHDDDFPQRVS